MGKKIISLANGIKIAVDDSGMVYGFYAGDLITADERHCKWNGEEVLVEGFAGGAQGKPKVIWARKITEDVCDCTHNPEGLFLLRRSSHPAVS